MHMICAVESPIPSIVLGISTVGKKLFQMQNFYRFILIYTRKGAATQLFTRPFGFLAIEL